MLKKAQLILYDLARRYGGYIPFSRLNTVYRYLDKTALSILDVGCENGLPMLYLNRKHRFQTVGVDISEEALLKADKLHTHNSFIGRDFMKLAIPDKSYDIVVCLQMIEHLPKDDGTSLIEKLERIARRQVIITTPVGFHEILSHPETAGADHKSAWTIDEFRKRGYVIRGNKLRIERRVGYFVHKQLSWLIPLHTVFWLSLDTILAPLPYYFPALFAFDMVCIKNLHPGGDNP